VHDRVLPVGLADTSAPSGKLRTATSACQTAIDDIIRDAGLAT